MNKTILLSGAVALLALVSCGGKSDEAAKADSALQADSLAAVQRAAEQAEQARQDSIRQDSIDKEEIDKQYNNAISLVAGKPSKVFEGDHVMPHVTLPITLVNNTDVDLTPSDYTIGYTISFEYQTDEDILDVGYKPASKKGPLLPAGQSVDFTLFHKETFDIDNPKAKLKISKEEFAKRYHKSKNS